MKFQVEKPANLQTIYSNIYIVTSVEENELGFPKLTVCGHVPRLVSTMKRFTPTGFLVQPTRHRTLRAAQETAKRYEEESNEL